MYETKTSSKGLTMGRFKSVAIQMPLVKIRGSQSKTDNIHCNFNDEAERTWNICIYYQRVTLICIASSTDNAEHAHFIDIARALLSSMATLLYKCLLVSLPLLPPSDCQPSFLCFWPLPTLPLPTCQFVIFFLPTLSWETG